MLFANQSALPVNLTHHGTNDYSGNAECIDNMNSYTESRGLVNGDNENYLDENDSEAE